MHTLSSDQQRAAVAPGHGVWASDGLLFMWLCPKQSINTVLSPSPLWKWADNRDHRLVVDTVSESYHLHHQDLPENKIFRKNLDCTGEESLGRRGSSMVR